MLEHTQAPQRASTSEAPLDIARLLPLLEMEVMLRADVVRARGMLSHAPTDFHRRQYVRAAFAQVEGTIFAVKQYAIPSDVSVLTPAELALLRGESYRLDDKGIPSTKWTAVSLKKDLRFAFRMYARSVGLKYELPVQEKGWEALLLAKEVRNRITHPQSTRALEISDSELEYVTDGLDWFDRQYRNLLDLMVEQAGRNDGLSDDQIAVFRSYREASVGASQVERQQRNPSVA